MELESRAVRNHGISACESRQDRNVATVVCSRLLWYPGGTKILSCWGKRSGIAGDNDGRQSFGFDNSQNAGKQSGLERLEYGMIEIKGRADAVERGGVVAFAWIAGGSFADFEVQVG